VDDYAHHPTEIQATLTGAKAMGKRIVAVFQPQRFSRTYFLMEEFSRAFGQADEVIITDIYSPPGEKPIPGVTSERLAELVRQNSNPNTLYCPTKEDVLNTLLERIRPNDLVMTMGAGDIWRVAQDLVTRLGERAQVGKKS
jgi:UDP-N-acetylmuramate--alanine ligase